MCMCAAGLTPRPCARQVRVLKARLAAQTAAAAELEAAAAEAAAAAAGCSALSSAAAAQKIQLTQQDQRVATLTDQARSLTI
jgi:hypothetical protein